MLHALECILHRPVALGCDHRCLTLLDDVVEEEDVLAPGCSQSLDFGTTAVAPTGHGTLDAGRRRSMLGCGYSHIFAHRAGEEIVSC